MKFLLISFAVWPFICELGLHAEPEHQHSCFSAPETREKILQHKLNEPFRVMRAAAAQTQAEAIGAKLCRWKEEFVYEISLLRRDGHVLHVFVNAADGHTVGSRNPPIANGRQEP